MRGAQYANASGLILMTKVGCRGDEGTLVDCPFQADTVGLTHAQDAGVKCYQRESQFILTNTYRHIIPYPQIYISVTRTCLSSKFENF